MRKNINHFILTGFLLLWSLFSSAFIFAEGETEYRFERMWPRLEQPWYFNEPGDVAIAPDGSVYIVDIGNHRIQKFTSQGEFIRTWELPFFPGSIAIAPDRSVYVASTYHIHQFTPQGDFIRKWGGKGSDNGQFSTLEYSDIAIAPDGSLYATDIFNHRIQQFTLQGDFIRSWGSEGLANGQFKFPKHISIASDSSVYITEGESQRIQQFTAQGEFIRTWRATGINNKRFSVAHIATAPGGRVYITDTDNRIQQFTSHGEFIRAWGSSGSSNGKFSYPKGIATASDDSIYI